MDIDMRKVIAILISLLEEQEGICIDYSFESGKTADTKAG